MGGTLTHSDECFRLPRSVEFQRWDGGDEWVVYHSGTGETLRLSDAAMAVIDLLSESGPLDTGSIAKRLSAQIESPMENPALARAVNDLLRVLLTHECIEPASCD